ncbi:hypothetical protein CEXT_108211 [Caerostris extrusa]|uniref:Uncharacterized protein n=1 Tax=Caerostris extrusa TaxID=172846 RepID=A0AAV4S0V7_CAEEX|nr:hypothetical protein CEXT_108211 [Caerostris extrusa]
MIVWLEENVFGLGGSFFIVWYLFIPLPADSFCYGNDFKNRFKSITDSSPPLKRFSPERIHLSESSAGAVISGAPQESIDRAVVSGWGAS